MRTTSISAWIAVLGLLVVAQLSGLAQTNCNEGAGLLARSQPQGISADDVIRRFSANESLFKEAQTHFRFTEDVLVQTLAGPNPDGEFRRVSEISFNQGKRMEYVRFAPQSTLHRVSMSKQDFDDLERSPFVLTTEGLPQYNVMYIGHQKIDMLETYVFDIAPKQIQKGNRYFQGRVWVEDQEFAIVKTCGKNVPEEDPADKKKKRKRGQQLSQNVEPTLVMYREQFERRYWFPTYARSDELLHFQYGDEVHLREVIKYTEYKRTDASSGAMSTARP